MSISVDLFFRGWAQAASTVWWSPHSSGVWLCQGTTLSCWGGLEHTCMYTVMATNNYYCWASPGLTTDILWLPCYTVTSHGTSSNKSHSQTVASDLWTSFPLCVKGGLVNGYACLRALPYNLCLNIPRDLFGRAWASPCWILSVYICKRFHLRWPIPVQLQPALLWSLWSIVHKVKILFLCMLPCNTCSLIPRLCYLYGPDMATQVG